jgi:FlaG/FlaF family flagellin (archaellin)
MNRRDRASIHARRASWRDRSRLHGHRRRGVADVVATILLLALTVTLFAALFAFVTRFPSPPAQSTDQFQASLITIPSNHTITGLSILHLAGPLVQINARVYLQSSVVGLTDWQLTTSGIPVNWGLNNTTSPWNLGEVWYTKFSPELPSYDNLTVFIISGSQLVFSALLGSSAALFPPVMITSGTTPSPVAVGATFQVYVTIGGNVAGFNSTNPLKINFASVPGLPTTAESMTCSPGPCTGATTWVFNVTSAIGKTTTNGTYYAFFGGNDSGGSLSGEVAIVITGTGSGGSGSSGGFTVLAGVSTSPPYPVPSPPPDIYLTATINYTGSSANVAVWANFTVSQLEGGREKAVYYNSTPTPLAGQRGEKMTGPETLVVYSQNPYSSWLLNSTAKITATVTLAGVATVKATTTLLTLNPLAAAVYTTTSDTNPFADQDASIAPTCSNATTCPYLYLTVWDNWTAALGGPASLTFNGTFWSNYTACNPTGDCKDTTFAVASNTVSAGSTTAANLYSAGPRWKPGLTTTNIHSATFLLTVLLTVSESGTTVGYVYDTFTVTVT